MTSVSSNRTGEGDVWSGTAEAAAADTDATETARGVDDRLKAGENECENESAID